MEIFRADGHLTDGAIRALCAEAELDGLSRLEMAEHLSFCDFCLERYTGALAGMEELALPENTCQKRFWRTARARRIRGTIRRCATAAAAVALALTMLWSGDALKLPQYQESGRRPVFAEESRSWPERRGGALDQAMSGLGEWLDGLYVFHQGGYER